MKITFPTIYIESSNFIIFTAIFKGSYVREFFFHFLYKILYFITYLFIVFDHEKYSTVVIVDIIWCRSCVVSLMVLYSTTLRYNLTENASGAFHFAFYLRSSLTTGLTGSQHTRSEIGDLRKLSEQI
jgi:hypothetical protein